MHILYVDDARLLGKGAHYLREAHFFAQFEQTDLRRNALLDGGKQPLRIASGCSDQGGAYPDFDKPGLDDIGMDADWPYGVHRCPHPVLKTRHSSQCQPGPDGLMGHHDIEGVGFTDFSFAAEMPVGEFELIEIVLRGLYSAQWIGEAHIPYAIDGQHCAAHAVQRPYIAR